MAFWDNPIVKKVANPVGAIQQAHPDSAIAKVLDPNPVKAVQAAGNIAMGAAQNYKDPYAGNKGAEDFLSKNNAAGVAKAGGDISNWWHKVIGAGGGAGGGSGGGLFGGSGGIDKIAYADAINKMMGDDGLYGSLMKGVQGQGPGAELAKNVMNEGQRQAALRGASLAASTKGVNPGMAAKMALDAQTQSAQQASNQGANLTLQDQLASQNQLGSMFGQVVGGQTGQNDALAKIISGQNAANAGVLGGLINAGGGILGSGILSGGVGSGAGAGTIAAGAEQGFGPEASTVGGGVATDYAPDAIETASATALTGNRPGSRPIPAPNANLVQQATQANHRKIFSKGGKVGGKAQVEGDDPKNDTVDAKLSPGEIVVPRSAADDPDKAHRFIDAIMDKKKAKKGFGGVLQARRELDELKKRMESLEARAGGAA